MAPAPVPTALSTALFLLIFVIMTSTSGAEESVVGVNYGTLADNLPQPSEVAKLVQTTSITRMKLYGADPNILTAFAHTGVKFVIGIANEQIGSLINLNVARQWVQTNVVAYMPATNITVIAVGNEVLATHDKLLISQVVRAMISLRVALTSFGLESSVKISSPHSLGVLHTSVPPSSGAFRRGLTTAVLKRMLDFLAKTGAPFMANAYPFFGYLGDPNQETLQYALFTSTTGYVDPNTKLHYDNMFDAQLDAIYSAMASMGYTNIDIMVSETGWPSLGDPNELGVSAENAQTYNNNLINHILSNRGTPLRPNKTIETYIFALFNENQKPGPTSERNYGLFKPDMSPVYSVAITNNQGTGRGGSRSRSGQRWCVVKAETDAEQLQRVIDFACGPGGADCTLIQPNQPCFEPDTLEAHASYAMNSYYQNHGHDDWNCYFNNSGMVVSKNPSYDSCTYPLS